MSPNDPTALEVKCYLTYQIRTEVSYVLVHVHKSFLTVYGCSILH